MCLKDLPCFVSVSKAEEIIVRKCLVVESVGNIRIFSEGRWVEVDRVLSQCRSVALAVAVAFYRCCRDAS